MSQLKDLAALLLSKGVPMAVLKKLSDTHPELKNWADAATSVAASTQHFRQNDLEVRLAQLEQRMESQCRPVPKQESGELLAKQVAMHVMRDVMTKPSPDLWYTMTANMILLHPEELGQVLPKLLLCLAESDEMRANLLEVLDPLVEICNRIVESDRFDEILTKEMRKLGPNWFSQGAGVFVGLCSGFVLDDQGLVHWHACPTVPKSADKELWSALEEAGHKRMAICCYQRFKFFGMLPVGAVAPKTRKRKRAKSK